MKLAAQKLLNPLLLVVLIAVGYLAASKPYSPYYSPSLKYQAANGLQFSFLLKAQPSLTACKQTLATIDNIVDTACMACNDVEIQCIKILSPFEKILLSEAPIDIYSARLDDGVVAFFAANQDIARVACEEIERQSLAKKQITVKCNAPGSARPSSNKPEITAPQMITESSILLAFAAFISWLVCYLIIRYEHLHAYLSHDHVDSGPQKFHVTPTTRIGGIAIFSSVLLSNVMISATIGNILPGQFSLLILASLPAFLGGTLEDITKKVGVTTRLLLTALSGLLAAWLLGSILDRTGIPALNAALTTLPLAIAFTAFAVAGISNSINIIDGNNGLSSGYSIILLTVFAIVYAQLNDTFLALACIVKIGAILGFFLWNWPKGRIFLGDGGAYLIGFYLAEISILGIVRHPELSPWFSVLLLTYPVFETIFSMFRRTFINRSHPGEPDALHLHQLIYLRLCHSNMPPNPEAKVKYNAMVAVLMLPVGIATSVAAVAFRSDTTALMMASLGFCAAYLMLYWHLVRWHSTPGSSQSLGQS